MKLLYILSAFFLSCSTEPEDVYGCTVQIACNFNSNATIFDDSCDYETCSGCTDETAFNYDVTATNDDGSCSYGISGTVRDEAGNTIPNAAILLTYTNGLGVGSEVRNRPSTTFNFSLPEA